MMGWVKHRGRVLLDALLPHRCLGCAEEVTGGGGLCPACFNDLRFIAAPLCACCGLPFDGGGGEDAGEGGAEAPEALLCADCVAAAPPYGRARAVLRYDGASAPLILRFKHADRTDSAPAFARWMARAGAELLDGEPLLVPVPLHRWRLFGRRYNQAALLAGALARETGAAWAPDALIRARRTVSQGRFGRLGRLRNVRGAFAVGRPQAVEGRRVVLIDDVMTTGATVSECARVLLRAGAVGVDVLALARVVTVDGG